MLYFYISSTMQVATEPFFMRASRIRLIKKKPLCYKISQLILSKLCKSKFPFPCLNKPLLLTIRTSLLSHCTYQKEEQANSGNILTKWRSFPATIKCISFLPWSSFSFTLLHYLSLSLPSTVTGLSRHIRCTLKSDPHSNLLKLTIFYISSVIDKNGWHP